MHPWTGVVRVLEPLATKQRVTRYDSVLRQRTSRVRIVLENQEDAGNAQATLRTAEGFGIQFVHAVERYSSFRGSGGCDMGTRQWLSVVRHDTTRRCFESLKEKKISIVASALHASARPLEEILRSLEPSQPIALVFGNESRGCSAAAVEHADHRFALPMAGMVESFNVSVAVAMSLQIARSEGRMVPSLTDEEMVEIKARWLLGDIKNARLILARHSIELDDY